MPYSTDGSDRSRSPSHSRTRSGDSYTNYSDDSFVSEGTTVKPKGGKAKNNKPAQSNLTRKNVNQKYGKGPTKKPGQGRASNVSKGTGRTPRDGGDYVARRMLSARRLKINELRNECESLHQELIIISNENKVLKRQHIVHEKALEKYEYQETDLPHIIERHNGEVRTLRDQVKKQKERAAKVEEKYRNLQTEHEYHQKQIKKLRSVINRRDLGERDELSRKITQLESLYEERDKRATDLERHIENLQKNHKHELGIERARHRETQRRLLDLQLQFDKTALALKEKEKELDVRNIYSNRLVKAPHNLTSARSSPRSRETFRTSKQNKSNPKRRGRDSPHIAVQPDVTPPPSEPAQPLKPPVSLETSKVEETAGGDEDKEMQEAEQRRLEEEQRRQEEEEMEEIKRRQEKEEEERKRLEEEVQQQVEEERLKEEREKEEREAEEKQALERDAKEREERERREKQEVERKADEAHNRLANDDAEKERLRQKELLLAKMKAIDDGKTTGDEILSPESQRKAYNFSQPTENMHNGFPAHESPSRSPKRSPTRSPTKSKPSFLDDISYNPTLTSNSSAKSRNSDSAKRKEKNKKNDNSLFGDDPPARNTSSAKKKKVPTATLR